MLAFLLSFGLGISWPQGAETLNAPLLWHDALAPLWHLGVSEASARPERLSALRLGANRRDSGTSDGSILNGGGPATQAPPLDPPFFTGWSADLASKKELLKTTLELGGVAVDPRTSWVYVTTRNGKLASLDKGQLRWQVDLDSAAVAPPAVLQHVVVVGSAEGSLYVFNKVTGDELAKIELGEELISEPLLVRSSAGLRAYVGSSAESLFAVDLDSKERLWRLHRDAPAGFTVRGFAKPVLGDGLLYAAHADGVVSAVDPESGVVHWERKLSTGREMGDVDSLAFDGERLFAASYSGGVVALDPKTGSTLWRFELPSAHQLVYENGRLTVTAPGRVVQLDAASGALRWDTTFPTTGALLNPIASSGLLVLGEDTGPLHFLNWRQGSYLGSFGPGSGFSSTPSSTGQTLYVLSNGGQVYSLGLLPPVK